MKKLFIAFTLIFLTASFSNQLLAQTKTCTPEQMEACQKICKTATVANCTAAQKTACQKVCNKSGEAKVACQKKMATCSPASSVKLTKNEKASCIKHDTKLVKNDEESAEVIAQAVSNN